MADPEHEVLNSNSIPVFVHLFLARACLRDKALFFILSGARDKFNPEKVKLKKTGGQNSKYFHGASLVCISDHFEQKFIGVRFFCI